MSLACPATTRCALAMQARMARAMSKALPPSGSETLANSLRSMLHRLRRRRRSATVLRRPKSIAFLQSTQRTAVTAATRDHAAEASSAATAAHTINSLRT